VNCWYCCCRSYLHPLLDQRRSITTAFAVEVTEAAEKG
jgi:hypothetical protein